VELQRSIDDFSEDDLRKYVCEHVLYEITHLTRATQAVETARAGLFPMNFAIEVFALHLRNLLDFFAPRHVRKTDACARHFHKESAARRLRRLTLPEGLVQVDDVPLRVAFCPDPHHR